MVAIQKLQKDYCEVFLQLLSPATQFLSWKAISCYSFLKHFVELTNIYLKGWILGFYF